MKKPGKPGDAKTNERIDSGAMRDKVVAFDPAAVPMDTDNEAAGAPTPFAVAEAADRRQMEAAQRAVPTLDRSRECSAPEAADPEAADADAVGPRRRPETWRTPRG
jgi:hypothetical protein